MAGARKAAGKPVLSEAWRTEILGAVTAPPPKVAAPTAPAAAAAPASADPISPWVRRVLKRRDPRALAELEAAVAEAAKGEAFFEAWLDRPIDAELAEEDADPLVALSKALSVATRHAARLPPLHQRAGVMLGKVGELSARLERAQQARPRPPTKDEVNERIAAQRDEARAKIEEHTAAQWKELAEERASLSAWMLSITGPAVTAEHDRRIARLLGEDRA